MNTSERRQLIRERLQLQKKLMITELAQQIDVSTMTIRRDFRRLIDLQIATPIHGGIVFVEGGAAFPAVSARERQMQREKNDIGNYCASLIKEGNAIYLDTGTTAMNIADALLGRHDIAVLSHSLPVLNILSHARDIQLISVPGSYHPESKGFYGDLAVRMVRTFRLDIAFIGVSGINAELGLMSPDLSDRALKQAILETARTKVLVVDHTKIGQESFSKICGLQEIDQIVTDKQADPVFLNYARRQGVQVMQV